MSGDGGAAKISAQLPHSGPLPWRHVALPCFFVGVGADRFWTAASAARDGIGSAASLPASDATSSAGASSASPSSSIFDCSSCFAMRSKASSCSLSFSAAASASASS